MIDLTGLGYFMPIFGFLFVFILVFAVLKKTKILGHGLADFIVSFIIASIFSTVSSLRTYVETIIPWFAVLIIAIFLMIILIALSQNQVDKIMKPSFAIVLIIILVLIFLISATHVFSFSLHTVWKDVVEFLDVESRIFGGIFLLIIAIVVGFIIAKK